MTRDKLERDFFELDEDDCGIPFESFVTALSVWAAMQDEKGAVPTVRQAADEFHVTDSVIRQAVDDHYWMFITGPDDDPTKQRIEHDGE